MTVGDSNSRSGAIWVWATLVLATLTVVGSISLTLVAGLKPCPLCFYQRTFAMGLLGLVAVGLLMRVQPAALAVGALPMVVGGFGVSVFHVYLELSKTLDCPVGLLGLATAPQQSFGMYVLLVISVLAAGLAARVKPGFFLAGGLLGVVFAVLSCVSNGPLPSTPNPKFDDAGNRVVIGCEPHWDESMPADG